MHHEEQEYYKFRATAVEHLRLNNKSNQDVPGYSGIVFIDALFIYFLMQHVSSSLNNDSDASSQGTS